MHDELTEVDIKKIDEEIKQRQDATPELVEILRHARELGDLSENEEYKEAKRNLNQNYRRIEYLTKYKESAHIIDIPSTDTDTVGLFDSVSLHYIEDDEDDEIRIVTTLRNDVTKRLISKESPVGKALLGRRLGETVKVKVSDSYSYTVKITAIKKGEDDESLEISSY